VAYYPFNGNANDASGNGNNASNIQAIPCADRYGNPDSAYSFNGTNSYVGVSNNLGGDFTISLWIKSTQVFPQTGNTYEGAGLFWSDVGGTHNDFVLGGTRSAAGTNRLRTPDPRQGPRMQLRSRTASSW